MSSCTSPSHKAYRNALETLYIQTWLARNELDDLVKEAWAEGDAAAQAAGVNGTGVEKGTALLLKEHKLESVVDRIAMGREAVSEATVAINAHFDRGCKNVPAEVPA
jgi:hypothetical protein